jgi:hypothetical protein
MVCNTLLQYAIYMFGGQIEMVQLVVASKLGLQPVTIASLVFKIKPYCSNL